MNIDLSMVMEIASGLVLIGMSYGALQFQVFSVRADVKKTSTLIEDHVKHTATCSMHGTKLDHIEEEQSRMRDSVEDVRKNSVGYDFFNEMVSSMKETISGMSGNLQSLLDAVLSMNRKSRKTER